MNKKALFYAILIVILFTIFSHIVFAALFAIARILIIFGLGYIVYRVLKNVFENDKE